MMKRIVVFVLIVCLAALLAGCSRKTATDKRKNYIEPAPETSGLQSGQPAGDGVAIEYDFAAAVRYEYINIKMSKYYEGEPLGNQELEMDFSDTECAKSGTLCFVPGLDEGIAHVTITTKDRECSEIFSIPDDAVPSLGLALGETLSEKTLLDYTSDNYLFELVDGSLAYKFTVEFYRFPER